MIAQKKSLQGVDNLEIYLDNSATTKVCREAADAMMKMLTENYGNPSSLHSKGVEASKALENARQNIADVFRFLRTNKGWKHDTDVLCYRLSSDGSDACRVLTAIDVLCEQNHH